MNNDNRLLRPLEQQPYLNANPQTGLPVASCLEEFYPLAENSVRLIHRTTANHIGSIIENGLVYNSSALRNNKISSELRYNNARDIVHDVAEEQFWQVMKNDRFNCGSTANADIMAVMDIPADEFYNFHLNPDKKYGKSAGAAMNGVIPVRYLVGMIRIPNKGPNSPQYSTEELNRLKQQTALKSPLYIEPEKAWRFLLQKYNVCLQNAVPVKQRFPAAAFYER